VADALAELGAVRFLGKNRRFRGLKQHFSVVFPSSLEDIVDAMARAI
jgi:hypothetical protein